MGRKKDEVFRTDDHCVFYVFQNTDAIKAEYPDIPAYETYDELFAAIKKVIEG